MQPNSVKPDGLLDTFLLDRIDEDADCEGKDEGLLNISELDGLLAAVVSGPVLVPPSQWIPAIWGDFEPQWQSQKQLEKAIGLLMRHMNDIADMLMNQPQDFEPIFMELMFEGRTYTIVDEWCEGYVRGVRLTARDWELDGDPVQALLKPIAAFSSGTEWAGHELE